METLFSSFRSREHGLDKMTASEFLTLSRIIEDFVAITEEVCGRKSTSFRMGLQGQVKFHYYMKNISIPNIPLFFFTVIIFVINLSQFVLSVTIGSLESE